MNETEGDANAAEMLPRSGIWWGEKSERLIAFGGANAKRREGERGPGARRRGRGRVGGTKAETTRQF